MTCTQDDPQVFFAHTLLPRLNTLLSASEYVHRLLFREQADVMTARAFHRFRKNPGAETDDDVLEDRELARQLYVLLLGKAGSGKSWILAFACTHAVQQFFRNPASPVSLFLDLDKDLPATLSVQSIEDALNVRHNGLFARACTAA